MSRIKKSRKPGAGSSGAIKADTKTTVTAAPRKPKNKKGKEAGNRQKEAKPTLKKQSTTVSNKDPRIGSKKPIDLGISAKTNEVKVSQKKAKQPQSLIAAIRTVEADNNLEQELFEIENDARLQEILAKQDQDIALTEDEVTLFNSLMDRHQELTDKLGIQDVIDDDNQDENADQAPWEKLDSDDWSDFKEE